MARIYVYAEQCISRGIARDPNPDSDDVTLYADSEAEAIETARADLVHHANTGAGGSYARQTARRVLDALDA
jgi:hypothetical protein